MAGAIFVVPFNPSLLADPVVSLTSASFLLACLAFIAIFLLVRRSHSTSNLPPEKTAYEETRSLRPSPKPSEFQSSLAQSLPPSRRHVLQQLRIDPHSAFVDVVEAAVRRRNVPHDASWFPLIEDHITPTGFIIPNIVRLGQFPDYAALSGVAAPSPVSLSWTLEQATARPYRPLRWQYHQTMSLSKMDEDYWVELDKDYKSTLQQRQMLFAKNDTEVLQALPGSELACRELMEMILQYLVSRYPRHFSLTQSTVGADEYVFDNRILNTRIQVGESLAVHPLRVLLDNVPEDYAIMLRNPDDGIYYLRAAVICSSLGWTVATKIGTKLSEIHAPVPDYKEKMAFSMDRFFAKMPTDKPIQRGSWGLEIDRPLFMPPGSPHEQLRTHQDGSIDPARVNFRVDWQTLRRLPLSGAIVFNFKALFTPITEFRDEAYVPSLLLRNLEMGKEDIMQYKATWHVEHVVKPLLREWIREQEDKGMVEQGWDVGTLDESPFWPGWREKWEC